MTDELKTTPGYSPEPDMKDAARTAEACAAESVRRLAGETGTGRDCADIYPDFKQAVERLSNGTNTVLLDDAGMPSVMVRIDRVNLPELLAGASDTAHPAFTMGGALLDSIYVSKYQNIVRGGRAYSLPMLDPQTDVAFGEACGYCAAKGPGWGLTPFAVRAFLALWAKRNGSLPSGNNDSGCDYFKRDETGVPTVEGRVATGSGPQAWAHNGGLDGIYDLNGNLNEWDAGLRLMDGEIQIIPGADCMLPGTDLSADSPQWRAIMPDGSLAAPGTEGTLRYGGRDGKIVLTAALPQDERGIYNCAFQDIRAEGGVAVPEIAKALMLFPESADAVYDGWRWINNLGECLPICGGAHRALDHAGVFFVGMTYPRSHHYTLSGFRSAYVPTRLK